MGYDRTRFIGDVDEEFCCGICLDVLHTPMQTPCGHVFCKECITTSLKTSNNRCPIDRLAISLSELKVPARPFVNLLNKLEMECDFGPNGCQAVLKLENLQAHLKSCQHYPKRFVEIVQIRQLPSTNAANDDLMSRLEEVVRHLKVKETNAATSSSRNLSRLPASNVATGNVNQSRLPASMWRMSSDMRITIDQSSNYILKSHDNAIATAQSKYSLSSRNSSFKVQPGTGIFDFGLTCKEADVNYSILFSKSIYVSFYSFRSSFLYLTYDGKLEKLPSIASSSGDGTLECGINFPPNFDSSRDDNRVEVYFSSNNEIFARKTVPMPRDGLYPTIGLYSGQSATYFVDS